MSAEAPAGEGLADDKLRLEFPAEHVARLTIDRAHKRNALDHAILDTISETLPGLPERGVRCLIFTAVGPTFSAGYDIGGLPRDEFAERAEKLVAHPFMAAVDALQAFPYPIIAALQGHAIGGGLELALACDLRIAAPGVQLGMPPAKLGLVYSHTGLRTFIDVIGAARTSELFLVGRRIDADTALLWGLVNQVIAADELADHALELATEIAANAPLSLEGNKRIIRALLDAEGELDPRVEQELIALREACFHSDDFFEGVRAFEEKRKANWTGR